MPNTELLRAAERVFEILVTATQPRGVNKAICLRFLATATESDYAEHPHECAAIVASARDNGASWDEIAAAARLSLADALQRWRSVDATSYAEAMLRVLAAYFRSRLNRAGFAGGWLV